MLKRIKKFTPSFVLDRYHWLMAFGSALIFGFPSRRIKVIGVTGTNGKTTTVNLIVRILEQGGYRVAALSSLRFKIGDREKKNKLRMTMPGRGMIQAFLKKAVKQGCEYAVIEVTSEGVAQHRHRFTEFEAAVLTNLSPEHIESHGSFEKYREAKAGFFKGVEKVHVLNADDENFEFFDRFGAEKKYYYGLDQSAKTGPGEFVAGEKAEADLSGIRFEVRGERFDLGLWGRFNIYNALAAVCVGLSQGVDLDTASRGLKKAEGVPGRMEMVIEKPFRVVVDYAFTPNALEKVYRFLRSNLSSPESRLISVLGACGGGRDKWKRPVLGGLAGRYCDRVIVTNEDPFDEDPEQIVNQVAEGAGDKAERILNRRKAIKRALELAQEGDTVVITGKGAEPSICLAGGKQVPWDDREVVREEYEKL